MPFGIRDLARRAVDRLRGELGHRRSPAPPAAGRRRAPRARPRAPSHAASTPATNRPFIGSLPSGHRGAGRTCARRPPCPSRHHIRRGRRIGSTSGPRASPRPPARRGPAAAVPCARGTARPRAFRRVDGVGGVEGQEVDARVLLDRAPRTARTSRCHMRRAMSRSPPLPRISAARFLQPVGGARDLRRLEEDLGRALRVVQVDEVEEAELLAQAPRRRGCSGRRAPAPRRRGRAARRRSGDGSARKTAP